jgi:hypothetical protein
MKYSESVFLNSSWTKAFKTDRGGKAIMKKGNNWDWELKESFVDFRASIFLLTTDIIYG